MIPIKIDFDVDIKSHFSAIKQKISQINFLITIKNIYKLV